MPRSIRRRAAVALVGAALVGLAACATAPPLPTPAPTPDASEPPIFASDEEALAAAVEAYEAYLAASDAITSDGGANGERIRPVTTSDFAAVSEIDFSSFAKAGLQTRGKTRVDSPRLTEYSQDSSPARVAIYACQDVSDVRLLNSSGDDVTPTDRDDRIPLLVEMLWVGDTLRVDGNQLWSGEDFC